MVWDHHFVPETNEQSKQWIEIEKSVPSAYMVKALLIIFKKEKLSPFVWWINLSFQNNYGLQHLRTGRQDTHHRRITEHWRTTIELVEMKRRLKLWSIFYVKDIMSGFPLISRSHDLTSLFQPPQMIEPTTPYLWSIYYNNLIIFPTSAIIIL